jgi:hypothetical protein
MIYRDDNPEKAAMAEVVYGLSATTVSSTLKDSVDRRDKNEGINTPPSVRTSRSALPLRGNLLP